MSEVQRLRAIVSGIDDLRAAGGRGVGRLAGVPAHGAAGEACRGRPQPRYWTEAEHRRFLDAIQWLLHRFSAAAALKFIANRENCS